MKSKPEICKWIQSSAIIKRSNIVRYCINNCRNSGRIHVSKICWIHKRYPYLTPSGELWDVFCEYFWENWPRYNSTTLYFHIPLPLTLESHGPLNRQLNWNSLPERSWNPPGLEHPSQNCGQLWDYPQWQKKPPLWTTGVVFARDWIKRNPGAIIVNSLITEESDLETHHHGDYSTAILSQHRGMHCWKDVLHISMG